MFLSTKLFQLFLVLKKKKIISSLYGMLTLQVISAYEALQSFTLHKISFKKMRFVKKRIPAKEDALKALIIKIT